jgi:transcriptional regulator with XRE-family HTH domain
MTTRTKKLATLLTTGVVLSSGAYALGSQTGDGGALASSAAGSSSSSAGANGTAVSTRAGRPGARGFRRGGGQGLDGLATKLGVTPATLQTALTAIRDEKTPAQRRAELAQALATALGKPVDQVTTAVNSVLPAKADRSHGTRGPGGDFAAAIAKALGVDVAKVQAGLDKARQGFRAGPRDPNRNTRRGDRLDGLVNDIASATGVDAAKVRSALQGLRPKLGDRKDRRGARDDIRQRLATALNVTPAALDAAFQTVRTQQRDAFATELAQKLNIDPQKVKDALPDFAGPGRRHG